MPDGVSDAAARVGDAAPSKDELKQKAQGAAETAKDNPIALVAGAAAAGLVAGLALPETDLEREKIGPHAQDARQQVQVKVQETVQHAKSSAQEAAQNVAGAVKEQGRQQGGKVGEFAETAADRTQEKMG